MPHRPVCHIIGLYVLLDDFHLYVRHDRRGFNLGSVYVQLIRHRIRIADRKIHLQAHLFTQIHAPQPLPAVFTRLSFAQIRHHFLQNRALSVLRIHDVLFVNFATQPRHRGINHLPILRCRHGLWHFYAVVG